MTRPRLTVSLITCNEEHNLARALKSVAGWADEVVVVDSGSTDRTVEIAREAGARVISNAWPGFGQQKNFAQSHATHDWILSLDADEEVSPALRAEIDAVLLANEAAPVPRRGFRMPRLTQYLGRWIRHGGWYPNYLVRLADRRHARWTEPEVHEEWKVDGEVGQLREPLQHYTFTGIADQVRTNLIYAERGAAQLRARGKPPSLARLLLKPVWKFIDTYFVKRGFMDGLPGLIISVNAAHSMFLKFAFLAESAMYAGHRDPKLPKGTDHGKEHG